MKQHIFISFVLALVLGLNPDKVPAETNVVPTSIRQSTDTLNNTSYLRFADKSIGKDTSSLNPYKFHKYRSFATFGMSELGLIGDEQITSVTLTISFGANQPEYSAKIVTLASDPSPNGEATIWSNIGAGTTLVGAVTTAGTQYPDVPSLVQKVQNVVDSGTPLYLGFMSNSENSVGTGNSVLYVHINFQASHRTFRYYAKNSYNAGPIRVDGVPYSSGQLFNWNINQQHTFTAVDTIYDGYNRVWATSGESRSNWRKKRASDPTEIVIQGATAADYPYFVSKQDSGRAFIADMKRVCNVILRQQSEFGDVIDLGTVASVVEGNQVSISAPDTMTVGGNTYPFTSWSDGERANPRTITPSVHTFLVALYKTHLASTNQNVTYAGGQRRIATWSAGYYKHVIYESSGEVWHCNSYGGGGMLAEIRLSSGNGGNANPSITIVNDKPYVTWERINGTSRAIYFSKRTSGTWQSPQIVAAYTAPHALSPPAFPVIGLHREENVLFINYSNGGVVYEVRSTNDGSTWAAHLSLPVSDFSLQDEWVPMKGTFAYQTGVWQCSRLYSGYWESYDLVPGSYWVNFSGEPDFTESWCWAPQIALSATTRIYSSWMQLQTCETTHKYVAHQSRYNGAWSTVTAYELNPETELSSPTMALTYNRSLIMWSEGNQLKSVSGYLDGTWGVPQSAGAGKNPTLGRSDLTAHLTYLVTQQSAPFSFISTTDISFDEGEEGMNPLSSPWETQYARVLFGVDTVTQRSFSIRMTQPTIGARRLAFVGVNDTLPNITPDDLLDYLGTLPATVNSAQDTLEFDLTISSHGFEEREFPVSLRIDGMRDDRSFQTFFSGNHNLRGKNERFQIRRSLSSFTNRSLRIQPTRFSFRELGPNWVFNLAHVNYPVRSQAKGVNKLRRALSNLPTEYAVSNYPNPFNPSATIKFDLPEPSHVSLIIYDVLGRKVDELENGLKEAGYHSAVWNASAFASGVYFARFTATDVSGNVKLNKVAKMLLTK